MGEAQSKEEDKRKRSFAVLYHVERGVLLLTCEKKKKGRHQQLPGGNIDAGEDARAACVREVYEETHIDVNKLLQPARLGVESAACCIGQEVTNVYKNRFYFIGQLSDADVERIRLSDEHVGFYFEKGGRERVAAAIQLHSGGKNSEAVRMMSNVPIWE